MKYAVLVMVFYFLTLLQVSFLPHFSIVGMVPNIVLLSVVFINFFEKSDGKLGLVAAFTAGIFLDIFSSHFMGFYIVILLATAILIKYILRKYITLPSWI